MSADRVPPYDGNAERAVLGSILLDNESFDIAGGIISESDFYLEANRRIFSAMSELVKSDTGIDPVTLGNILKKKGDLEKVGGPIVLSNLVDDTVTAENIEHYAGIVRESSGVRKVIYAAQTVAQKGFSVGEADGLIESIEDVVEASHYLSRTRMPESILGLGEDVIELYKKVASGYRGIPLPWKTLDDMTVGMWNKTVTVFVARPNVGKSFVAIVSAFHAWQKGNRVLIISPEMSKQEIAERFFAIKSGVSYRDMVRGSISDFQFPSLKGTVDDLKDKAQLLDSNIWIMDSENDISPRGIEAAIRACKPDLVAVDSLYHLKVKGDRRDRLLVALDWVVDAAKRLDFASCVFAQQNRAAELSEKKGGGSRLGTIALADEMAQDTHAIFALEQSKDDRADKVLKIRPLKIRRGYMSKEVIKLHWDWDEMNWEEIPDEDEEYEDNEDIPF